MSLNPKKKRIAAAVLFLVALYLIWLGLSLVRYREPRVKRASKQRGVFEIEGVYHIHTTFSDGRKTPEEIAALATRQALDFIVLTDHGKPNLESLASQGWKDKVLVLAGSELSVSRGHLVALGFDPPHLFFSQNADRASREVEALGGFSVIAHPFSKTRWSWGERAVYSGMEIIDADTMIKKNFLSSLPYLPALLIKPGLYLLKIIDRPDQTLRKWDELSRHRPMSGYFSADAHMLYSILLSCFRLHVLIPKPLSPDFETAKAQIFSALRQGRFYSAIDAASSARGFRFRAERGQAVFPMGSKLIYDPLAPVKLRVRAPFPFKVETRIIHDGKSLLSSEEKEVSLIATEPGTYRVEMYLRSWSPLARDVPWIISNPIFLKEDGK
jgi:hypothetical protein